MEDIQDIRRARLVKWLETHSTPQREKSLFSQLKTPGNSFGEKVARRLEQTYGMGTGYLDSDDNFKPPISEGFPPLSPESKMLIGLVERVDGLGAPMRKLFVQMAGILEVAEALSARHNQDPSLLTLLDQADDDLTELARSKSPRVKNHATRKRESK